MALDRRRIENQPEQDGHPISVRHELVEGLVVPFDQLRINLAQGERDNIFCHVCGFQAALEVHCKIICRNCGYTRDCSDP